MQNDYFSMTQPPHQIFSKLIHNLFGLCLFFFWEQKMEQTFSK